MANYSMTWEEAVPGFEDHLRQIGRSYSIRKEHRTYLTAFARDHAWMSPWAISPDHIARWIAGRSTQYIARHAATTLRLFYAWAVRCGHLTSSPATVAVPSWRPNAHTSGPAVHVVFPEAWIEPVTGWVAYLRAAAGSERSVKLWRNHLSALARTAPDPWQVTGPQLVGWMAGRNLKPETRKSVRSALRSFYGWAVTNGHLSVSPADALPSVRIPESVPRPVTDDALTAALTAADDKTRLMVCLGAFAGLRNVEIAAVRPSRDIVDGRLYVTGKGGKQRVVPVHPVLAREIADELARRRTGGFGSGFRYMSTGTADGWLFPSPRGGGHVTPDAVHNAISGVLPPGWTPHKLRHRFATRAYQYGGKDLEVVRRLLGHSSITSTVRYTAVADDALTAAVLAI